MPVMESIPTAGVEEVQPMLAEKALRVTVAATPVEQPGLRPAAGVLTVGAEAAVEAVGGEVPLVAAVSVEAALPAREGSMSSSTPGVDPLDRSVDRAFARLGMLEDAPPVFAPGKNLP